MSLTRRHFVQVASLSALAGAAFPAAFSQRGFEPGRETFSSENLAVLSGASWQEFQPLIGESFAISNASQSLGTLTLLSVNVPTLASAETKAQFSGHAPRLPLQLKTNFTLQFQGSGGLLAQGTYTFENSSIGSFALFIVPSGPGSTPPTYTAVFSFLN
jgi:hypothetical protein